MDHSSALLPEHSGWRSADQRLLADIPRCLMSPLGFHWLANERLVQRHWTDKNKVTCLASDEDFFFLSLLSCPTRHKWSWIFSSKTLNLTLNTVGAPHILKCSAPALSVTYIRQTSTHTCAYTPSDSSMFYALLCKISRIASPKQDKKKNIYWLIDIEIVPGCLSKQQFAENPWKNTKLYVAPACNSDNFCTPSISKQQTNHTRFNLSTPTWLQHLPSVGWEKGKSKNDSRSKGGKAKERKRCIVTAQHLNECVFLGMLAPALKHENEHRLWHLGITVLRMDNPQVRLPSRSGCKTFTLTLGACADIRACISAGVCLRVHFVTALTSTLDKMRPLGIVWNAKQGGGVAYCWSGGCPCGFFSFSLLWTVFLKISEHKKGTHLNH